MKTFSLKALGRLLKPGAHPANSTHLARDESDSHAVLRTLCPRYPPLKQVSFFYICCQLCYFWNNDVEEVEGPRLHTLTSSPLHCTSIHFHHDPNTITRRPCGFYQPYRNVIMAAILHRLLKPLFVSFQSSAIGRILYLLYTSLCRCSRSLPQSLLFHLRSSLAYAGFFSSAHAQL